MTIQINNNMDIYSALTDQHREYALFYQGWFIFSTSVSIPWLQPAEELSGMISLLRDKFVRSENLRRCFFFANKKKFSFRWIEKQFVQVHPGKNVSKSGGECFQG